MKKLALVLLTLILLAACGTAAPEEEPVETKVYKVALLVGELGDLSLMIQLHVVLNKQTKNLMMSKLKLLNTVQQ